MYPFFEGKTQISWQIIVRHQYGHWLCVRPSHYSAHRHSQDIALWAGAYPEQESNAELAQAADHPIFLPRGPAVMAFSLLI